MAWFKIKGWKDVFPSAYSVIMEIEKKWPNISAKPMGDTYLLITEDPQTAEELKQITQLDEKPVTLEELLPDMKPCTFVVTRVPLDVPEKILKDRIPGARQAERQIRTLTNHLS